MGNVLFLSIPSIFMVLLLGPWTDTGGRRPALLAPPIGSAVEAILILVIMYLEWPVYMLFVGEAINGFSGFATIMTMAAFSYVSDITTEQKLALHIGQYVYPMSILLCSILNRNTLTPGVGGWGGGGTQVF